MQQDVKQSRTAASSARQGVPLVDQVQAMEDTQPVTDQDSEEESLYRWAAIPPECIVSSPVSLARESQAQGSQTLENTTALADPPLKRCRLNFGPESEDEPQPYPEGANDKDVQLPTQGSQDNAGTEEESDPSIIEIPSDANSSDSGMPTMAQTLSLTYAQTVAQDLIARGNRFRRHGDLIHRRRRST